MKGWWTALRIARREARRAKGRSTLVGAMIALPIMAVSFVATTYDMFRLQPEEVVVRELGGADAKITWRSTGPVQQSPNGLLFLNGPLDDHAPPTVDDLRSLLPAGSRLMSLQNRSIELRTATGFGHLPYWTIDLTDPMATGMVKLVSGTAPVRADEIAITRHAGARLGVGVGGAVETADRARRFTVTAIVEFPSSLDERVVVRHEAVADELANDASAPWLVDTPGPVTWAQVLELNKHGYLVNSRDVVLNPPPADQVQYRDYASDTPQDLAVGVIVVGLAMFEVVLLAGPAFAVGARRRRRELALVAANGATPAHLRRIVLADGVVLGLVGAAVGVVLGVAGAFAAHPLVEEYVQHYRAGGYRVFALAQLAIVGIAVATGLLAALVPAFTTARQDVVAALAGRRGITRSRRRWLVVGLVVVAGGAGLCGYGAWQVETNLVLAGLVVGQLGLVLCTPALVGLVARFGRLVPLGPRIALRDTARNRAAAAPAVSAVMAAVAGAMAIGVYFAADFARTNAAYEPARPLGSAVVLIDENAKTGMTPVQLADVETAARAALPVHSVVPVYKAVCATKDGSCPFYATYPESKRCPYWVERKLTAQEQRLAKQDERCRTSGWSDAMGTGLVVDDGTAVGALTGATGEDLARAQAMLRAGGVVVTDPQHVLDGKVWLVRDDYTDGTPKLTYRIVAGYAVTSDVAMITIFSPTTFEPGYLTPRAAGLVITTTRMPTQAENDALNAGVRRIDPSFWTAIERGPNRSSAPILLLLAVAAGVITLGASGIATGLAAADRRADLATLGAVGASPGVRRVLSLCQSGVIAGLGSVLGAVAGAGAAVAVLFALNRRFADTWPAPEPYPIAVPWLNIAVAVAVVPILAMLLAGLLTRSRLPIERRL